MAKGSGQGAPATAKNSEGDTKKVNRKPILLNWKFEVSKRDKDPTTKKWIRTGTRGFAEGDSILYYPEKLINWFEIPNFTGSTSQNPGQNKRVLVSAHQRTIYRGIDDQTGSPIQIPEFERITGKSGGGRKNLNARVNLGEGRVTQKGNLRTVLLAFPPFFTIQMIAQAIGSMIRTTNAGRKPGYFQMVDSGSRYAIPYNTDTAPLAGFTNGAWIGTALMPEDPNQAQGGDNVTGNDDVTSSAGDMNSGDNDTAP